MSVLRSVVVWITVASFVMTQTAAVAGPHEDGMAAGQAANSVVRGQVNAPSAASVVPGYTTTPPQSAYYGHPNLSGQAGAQLAACALTPTDPVCQALLGARASANTPRAPVSPHDPAVVAARRTAANPGGVLEDIATYYSGCEVSTVGTPATETRICRQYAGTTPQSCARSLSVSIERVSSCTPGEWFVTSASGGVTLALQCKPDQPTSAQRMRITGGGTTVTYFDADVGSGLVFPQMATPLPSPPTSPGSQNGVWLVDNRCTGDFCRLTGFVAQEYREICTGGGESADPVCTRERPFLEVYGACPAGTQSGDHIVHTSGTGGDSGDVQTTTLDEASCYKSSDDPTDAPGHDETGTLPGPYWRLHSKRPVVGYRLNPNYGPIPQMAMSFERPHTTVTEFDQWSDHCPALSPDGRCAPAGAARCVDGPATKVVDGASVTRDCWRYETPLSCAFGDATDECAPLVAAGCTSTGTVCRRSNPVTGICEIAENTYSCPAATSTAATVTNCPANVYCIAGNCFDTSHPNDADLARSMTFLEAAREAGVYMDTDALQVFSGESNRCRDRLLKNCCYAKSAGADMDNRTMFGVGSRLVYDALMNAGNRQFLYQGMQALLMGGGFSGSFTSYGVTVAINGTALPTGSAVLYAGESVVVAFDPWSLVIAIVIYIVMSMMSCDEEEGKLAMKEGARLCHAVGTYCSSCLRVLGHCVSCLTHTTSKCCFNSVLARLLNEQGRAQFGKGWGSAEKPDCSGFTIAQLQSLDFSRLDLTEFYASIVPTLPDVGAIQSGNTSRAISCYYGEGRCQ